MNRCRIVQVYIQSEKRPQRFIEILPCEQRRTTFWVLTNWRNSKICFRWKSVEKTKVKYASVTIEMVKKNFDEIVWRDSSLVYRAWSYSPSFDCSLSLINQIDCNLLAFFLFDLHLAHLSLFLFSKKFSTIQSQIFLILFWNGKWRKRQISVFSRQWDYRAKVKDLFFANWIQWRSLISRFCPMKWDKEDFHEEVFICLKNECLRKPDIDDGDTSSILLIFLYVRGTSEVSVT